MEIQKKSSVFMIIVMITIGFSPHISHSVNVEKNVYKTLYSESMHESNEKT